MACRRAGNLAYAFGDGGESPMDEQLFPVRPARSDMPLGVLVLETYREDGTWLFDDPATNLRREPFVG
jgi:hypothetical protein